MSDSALARTFILAVPDTRFIYAHKPVSIDIDGQKFAATILRVTPIGEREQTGEAPGEIVLEFEVDDAVRAAVDRTFQGHRLKPFYDLVSAPQPISIET